MFRVELEAARQRWIGNCDEEDGSFTENSDTGKAERSQQRYESMREPSTVGGESTGNMGGRAYTSSPIGPTQYIEHLNQQRNSSSS